MLLNDLNGCCARLQEGGVGSLLPLVRRSAVHGMPQRPPFITAANRPVSQHSAEPKLQDALSCPSV